MMTLISMVNRIYGSQGLATMPSNVSYCCRKLHEMPGNTLELFGKVGEFYFA